MRKIATDIITFVLVLTSMVIIGHKHLSNDQVEALPEYDLDYYVQEIVSMLPYEPLYRVPTVKFVSNLKSSAGADKEFLAAGVCYRLKNGQPAYIAINTELWAKYTETERFTVMAHELGHCLYGLMHTDGGLMHRDATGANKEVNEHGIEEAIKRALEAQ